jgi:hypothetical protein
LLFVFLFEIEQKKLRVGAAVNIQCLEVLEGGAVA